MLVYMNMSKDYMSVQIKIENIKNAMIQKNDKQFIPNKFIIDIEVRITVQ